MGKAITYVLLAFFGGSFLSALVSNLMVKANRLDEASIERPGKVIRYVRDDVGGLLTAMLFANGLLAAILAALLVR